MPLFSPCEKETLIAICEALIPALEPEDSQPEQLFRSNATQYDIATLLEDGLERYVSPALQRELQWALRVMSNGFANGISAGYWKPLAELSLTEREDLLYQWATSRLSLRRKAFQGIKRFALFLHYAHLPDEQHNPLWSEIQYAGPPEPVPQAPRPIVPLEILDKCTLETDILIIGSGAGGGVVAGELSAAGYDVIIAEKGGYYTEPDFHGRESDSNQLLYEQAGALTSVDGAITIFASSTLGGGTTVNWAASFRTPEHVLQEWAHDLGFAAAANPAYKHGFYAIEKRININTNESNPNRNNQVLEAGCKALQYDVDVIARNVNNCGDCGYCGFGCRMGAKQSTTKTYLQDAYDRGARFLVQATVRRVLQQAGKAIGAVISVVDRTGEIHKVTVQARAVVAAAGSIHTPALLKRSGLQNPHIGANLHLHPVSAVFSRFDDPVLMWQGAPMTRICTSFADLDGRGYGVRLETAPVHPGLSASALPWTNARAHKQLVAEMPTHANIIILTRDYYGGQVRVNRQGDPVLHYKLHRYDENHLIRGLQEAVRVHEAAGANEIYTSHSNLLSFRKRDGRSLETFLHKIASQGVKANACGLFSAHQMSSCRIADTPTLGAVDVTGESYEVKNLFVADASALPTATGVNPMLSIMALAHYVAQSIKSKVARSA